MTLRSIELIGAADVILYDRLIPDSALANARPEAELIYVGKMPGSVAMTQDEINATLVDKTRAGGAVVRLKGGDPFVFGRGGEEALELAAAGLPFEIVPSVTAGVAASAYAGIPVTQREISSAVAFVTGHEDPLKPETAIDWRGLATFPGTLVFYMGVKRLPQITSQLIECGRRPDEPVAVIERGTQPGQRTVTGTLSSIADVVADAEIVPPSLTVIGNVVELRTRLAWFEDRPLAGKTVTVTRARSQASKTIRRLNRLGARTIETPTIRTESLPAEIPSLESFDLLIFTSTNAVDRFFELLLAGGRDARSLAHSKIAAIGKATERSLASFGISADLIPERATAEGLLDLIDGDNSLRVLIPRAESARELLPETLRERGCDVTVLPVYRTVAEQLDARRLETACSADYVTFASASAVENFWASADSPSFPQSTKIVSIGPITSAALKAKGCPPNLEAAEHNIDGLIDVILKDA